VNSIDGAPLLLASAGILPATDSRTSDSSWSGLAVEASRIGVDLDTRTAARLARFRDLLLERNAHVNLTAIRLPVEVERRLFLDALAMIPAIDAFLETARHHPRARLIDIGSGAGFPGLVLKIARPDLDVTLLDATAKKVAFLDDVIADLKLEAIHAVHGRAEELGQRQSYREQFAIATARAVASLPVLLEFVLPFLDIGGQAFLPKGLAIDDELRAGRRAAKQLGGEIISAQRAPVGETRLVIARKTTLTAKAYPRRTGIPAHSPLGQGS
jgi:16S rRNA (guanine527-N7)-methyltransferase